MTVNVPLWLLEHLKGQQFAHQFSGTTVYDHISTQRLSSFSLSRFTQSGQGREQSVTVKHWWAKRSDAKWAPSPWESRKSWHAIIENDSQEQQNTGWNNSQLFLKQYCVRVRLIWHWLTGLSPFISRRDTLCKAFFSPSKINCWMMKAHKLLGWLYKESTDLQMSGQSVCSHIVT